MTANNEKPTADKVSVEDDDSPRMRKRSPLSKRRNMAKYGSIKVTGFSSHAMSQNIKNAEGTNTNSFYYVSMETSNNHDDVTHDKDDSAITSNSAQNNSSQQSENRKLIADTSWGAPLYFLETSQDKSENSKTTVTSFSRNEPSNQSDRYKVLYDVSNPVPGGFPFIKLHQSTQSDDITDGTEVGASNIDISTENLVVTSPHSWSSPRSLLKLNVFSGSFFKRNNPSLALPKSILKNIELSDKAEIQDAFAVMSEGEVLLMVEHTRWITRTVNTLVRLEEDCITVSYTRNRCWLPRMECTKITESFDIRDVMMARAGRDGLLRVVQGDLPETRCFSIVFCGGKKTMNFLAPTDDSAKCWVRGLNYIKKKFDTISPRLNQQLFLWEIFRKADGDNDGKLTFPEVHELFRRKGGLITREDRRKILENFLTKVTTEDPHVDFELFIEFYQTATLLPEFESIFKDYSADKNILTAREIFKFLQESQGEYDITEDDCLKIIEDYEMSDEIRAKKQMSVHGFVLFMLSPNCDVFNRRHDEVYQDMKHPISHYFIASSHNTYLMADQLRGPSSTDAYMKALLQGCRCVELDCWDGVDCEPVIFHGHTLTSKIKFKDAIEVIGKYAFEVSRYPLILSIENHCSVKQQEKMAEYMQRILGTELLTESILSDSDEEHLPSPIALQGKILIKGKKIPALTTEGGDDGDVSDEDEAAEMNLSFSKNRRGPLYSLFRGRGDVTTDDSKPKTKSDADFNSSEKTSENLVSSEQSLLRTKKQEKKLKLSKKLSDQVVYCKSCKFKGIDEALRSTSYKEISSFSENKAFRLATQSRGKAIRFHAGHLNRTYPGASRTDSSNYNPQPLWNAGFQVVALNYQTKCDEMTLYHAKFRQNGRCGYVLKPKFMRSSNSINVTSKEQPKEIVIKVICGSDIPVDVRQESLLVVEVGIQGDPLDEKRLHTKPVRGNGYNPVWDETLLYQVSVPSLAMVWFKVLNENSDNVGQFVLPLTSLAEGYRTVHLLDRDGSPLKRSHLLVRITVTKLSRGNDISRSSSSSRSGRSSMSS